MTQQTKTLKELLSNPCENIKHDCVSKCEDCLIELVKEWLTQKRQELDDINLRKSDSYAVNYVFNELLEELNRNE